MNLVVENPNLQNLSIGEVPGREVGVVVSRIKRAGAAEVETATEQTACTRATSSWRSAPAGPWKNTASSSARSVKSTWSRLRAASFPARSLSPTRKCSANRSTNSILMMFTGSRSPAIDRADIEMTAIPALRLQFGDVLQVVGEEAGHRQGRQADRQQSSRP